MTKRVLITHNDLDGIGCAILFAKCFPDAAIVTTDYSRVNEVVEELLNREEDIDILISDISVNEAMAERLDKHGKVGLLDHHDTAKWLSEKYHWAHVDSSKCGTRMVYEMFSQRFHLEDYAKFVDLVEDWDLWGQATGKDEPGKDAVKLELLFGFLGHSRFFNMMVSSPEVPEKYREVVEILWEKFYNYAEESIKLTQIHKKDGYKFGICIAERYKSLVGHVLVKELDLEYVILLDPRRGQGSLRGKGNIHLGWLAKQAGGGGHRKAAGFPLGNNSVQAILNMV